MRADTVDIDVKRASRWLTTSAMVVLVCGALAIVLPVTFPSAIAALLRMALYHRSNSSFRVRNSFRKGHLPRGMEA